MKIGFITSTKSGHEPYSCQKQDRLLLKEEANVTS